MTTLIDTLHLGSPVVRAMLGLLPHMPAPVVFGPGHKPGVPRGCLHLPSAGLIIAGAGLPADAVAPALAEIDRLARVTRLDVLLLSLRAPGALHPVRADVVLRWGEDFRCRHDLLLWRLRGHRTALVTATMQGPSVVLGPTGLILRDAPPYRGTLGRIQGLAFASAGQRLTLGDVA